MIRYNPQSGFTPINHKGKFNTNDPLTIKIQIILFVTVKEHTSATSLKRQLILDRLPT